jgi:hypothetical protein
MRYTFTDLRRLDAISGGISKGTEAIEVLK